MTIISASDEYTRAISKHERKFLCSPSSYISLTVRLNGSIEEDSFRRAIEKVTVTYPILGTRVVRKGEDQFLSTEDSEGAYIAQYKRNNEYTWFEALNIENERLTDITKGHLSKFILTSSPEVSEICVCIHHLISDGMSLVFVMDELLQHLDDPTLTPKKPNLSPPANPDIYPEGTKIGRFTKWYLDRINKKWEKEKIVFDSQDCLELWEAFWKRYDYKIELIELTKEQTTALVEVCRKEKVTVNSALLIAYYHARELAWEKMKKAIIASAVDTRDILHADLSRAVGLYAGGVTMKYKYDETISFWDNVRKFHKVMVDGLKNADVYSVILKQNTIDPTLLDALLFHFFSDLFTPQQSRYQKITQLASREEGLIPKFMKSYTKDLTDLLITNLGRINIPDYVGDTAIERVFFIPGAGFKLVAPLGAATAGGSLTITLNYFAPSQSPERMRALSDKAKEVILDLISK